MCEYVQYTQNAIAMAQYKIFLYMEMLNTKMCYYLSYINYKIDTK